MMEVLNWHLHAPLRLFILQVSDLMFFCHGLAFCHILVVVRDHALLTSITTYFKHSTHPPYPEATFSINSQNMWHVTITTNPLKWIKILNWTFTIFKPYKPSHHNWNWVCQPCFNLGLLVHLPENHVIKNDFHKTCCSGSKWVFCILEPICKKKKSINSGCTGFPTI
jgi:hypothetical protein